MKFTFIISVLTLLSVVGCSSAPVVGAKASALSHSRSFSSAIDDQSIELQAAKLVVDDPKLVNDTRIITLSNNGNVLLIGQAPSKALKAHAEALISKISGIKVIYNEIRLGGVITVGSQTSDSWLTTKIKVKLYNSSAIPVGSIKVVTENDEVFLIGQASKAQADAAVDIARNVNGVRKVIKVFEIKKDNQ